MMRKKTGKWLGMFLVMSSVVVSAASLIADPTSAGPAGNQGNPSILEAVKQVQSSVNSVQTSINGLQNSINNLAQPLGPTKPSQLVTIQGRNTACGTGGTEADKLVLPDGSTDSFAIPAGRVLVVTAIGLRSSLGAPAPASLTTQRFGLQLISATGGEVAMEDQLLVGPTSNGFSGKTSAAPNIVVRPGVVLCVFNIPALGGSFDRPSPVYVYGFLTDDK